MPRKAKKVLDVVEFCDGNLQGISGESYFCAVGVRPLAVSKQGPTLTLT